MTDKAQKILRRINRRRVLKRLNNPGTREKILREFNDSTLDDVGPLAGDKGEKFLSELNEMADLESKAGRRENPGG
jgi:transcription antitermination factor NusA-like protein